MPVAAVAAAAQHSKTVPYPQSRRYAWKCQQCTFLDTPELLVVLDNALQRFADVSGFFKPPVNNIWKLVGGL